MMSSLVFLIFNFLIFYLVNNSSYLVNNLAVIIVPEKPPWGGSIKYVCMYVCILQNGCSF